MDITPEYLYQRTLAHLSRYKKGTQPYQQWQLLQLLVALYKPDRVLDLGTAIGLTAITIAQSSLDCVVDTVDMELINIEKAKEMITQSGLSSRVFLHHCYFQDFLSNSQTFYDMIFFDGFNLEWEVFLGMESRLDKRGLMVVGNVWQKKKNPVVDKMLKSDFYKYPVMIEDTIFALHNVNSQCY